jgi:hypothetical protein
MKPLSISRRWWVLLLGLGLLNLTVSLVFPGCGILDNIYNDWPVANTPVRQHMETKPGRPAMTAAQHKAFLGTKPIPETIWNRLGLWRKIRSTPPTYVPRGYASTPPEGNSHGTWFVDPRDGKRLFAPNTNHMDLRPSVWATEAGKITGHY